MLESNSALSLRRDAPQRPRYATRRAPEPPRRPVPRLGFLGVGWIGRSRMEALLRSGLGRAAVVADGSAEARSSAAAVAPDAEAVDCAAALLERADGLDGVVIATPSAQHADQAIAALERGLAVFCQKPLGRTGAETRRVIEAARRADRLLDVDMSYRFTRAGRRVRELVASGALGRVYAADLVFHNAYGPDKEWFYDVARSGGGCLMDLGIHLVDLALWALPGGVEAVSGRMFAGGEPLRGRDRVEDYAVVTLRMEGGAVVRISCSWNLPAGRDAEISAVFYGTDGGAALRNVDGSFYDLIAERMEGTRTERLIEPPDEWGGRALVDWARRLGESATYDESVEELVRVAEVVDRIYEACGS